NNSGGFTYANFKIEINAGRPVLLNLEGHSIVGVGYSTTSNTIYIHDTWHSSGDQTMTWGGSYSGMALQSVSIVNLQSTAPVTVPTPLTPSGATYDKTPTYTWTKVNGATNYQYQLYKGTTLVYTKTVTSSVCGATTCSNTPTNTLAYAAYRWRVKAKIGGIWKPYSVYKNFSIAAPPVIPTPVTPSGTITDRTPTYKWTKISGATYYQYQLYRGTTLVYTKTVSSSVCGATTCSNTPTNILAYAAYKWRVKAKVGGIWKPYSAYKTFTVSNPNAGFNSDFNGTKTGWSNVTGTWNIFGGKYLHSSGLLGTGASAVHINNYANFTYTVRMKRSGTGTGEANRIIIRGDPSALVGTNWWKPSYYFQYTNDGSYSVYAVTTSGTQIALKSWTTSSAIVKSGWNTLKVVAVGSSLKYYINNTLVWDGSDSSLTTGQVGFGFYRGPDPGVLDVDWATLAVMTSDPNLSEEVAPGMELSGGTIDESP
ncbi:MAG: family 16 glycoside hydrolase, partial [Chloroflexota bacterium]